MIHVCSLARLHATVEETGARHVVTLINDQTRVVRPETVAAEDHLFLGMHDIAEELEGFRAPGSAHVEELLGFVRRWPRRAPLVVHCWAGISRSTAGAFIAACALNPERDETIIARAIREASPTASPNPRLVALADRLLARDGRMVAAIAAIGPGLVAA
ncbi:MAG: tyrosine protein phosphatase, partial [Variibacter sp.]|nr:tyrosine protein phosphatase [Variibacter sp.]